MRRHATPLPPSLLLLALTDHARERMAQRGISLDAVSAAHTWGTELRQRRGYVILFLGRRAVEEARGAGDEIGQFISTAIVLSADGSIVTVMRAFHTRSIRPERRNNPRRRRRARRRARRASTVLRLTSVNSEVV